MSISSHAPTTDVHRSLQNYGSSVWNLLHIILLMPGIWRQLS